MRDADPSVSATLVYGSSRPLVNLVLFALAEGSNPRFQWLDIRSESEAPGEWDPVRMGWLKERRVWTVDPREGLSPDNPRANAAMFHLVRTDEPPLLLARLAEFLRLPTAFQEVLAAMPAASEANLLAVANADRITGSIPDPGLGSILSAFSWVRCSLFVGYVGARSRTDLAFGRVVRVEGTSPAQWRDARVDFEKGSAEGGPSSAHGVSPADVPILERAFRRATS